MIEGEFSVDAGLKLASKTWAVEEGVTRKGVVLFLHDLAEYTGVYDEFFKDFAKNGFEVVSYDQRGSGLSVKDGRYAGITNEHFVFDDLNRIIVQLFSQLSESSDKPYDGKFYLMGHGMGASIILNYGVKGIYRERVDGFIAGGTWVALGNDVFSAWTLKVQLPLMSKVKPKSQFTRKLRWERLTNDEEIANKLRNDVKIRHTFSAGQIDGCLDRASRLTNSVFVSKFIGRPVLLLHGSDDAIFPLSGAQQFFNMLQVEDKKMVVLKNFLHQPYNQIKEERDEYRTDIIDWLNEKCIGESKYLEFTPKESDFEESTKQAGETSGAPVAAVDQTTEETAKESTSTEGQAEPAKEEITQGESTIEETAKEEPTTEESATEEATTEEPATEEATTEEPATEEATTGEATTEEPATEEATTEEPATEEPTTEEATTEEPATEEPATEEATTEEPATEEATTEEPATEEPTTEEPTTEEPATEEATTEEPATEEPTTEEATTEEPVLKETTETATEEPLTQETKEEPVSEETKEESVFEKADEKPAVEETTEKPVVEEAEEEPSVEEPVKEEHTDSTEPAGEPTIAGEADTPAVADKQESTENVSGTETTPEPETAGSTPTAKPNTNTAKKNNKKKNNKKKGGKKK